MHKWRLISHIGSIMDNEFADPPSQKINGALRIVLVDRLKEIASRRCYVCDGFGHSVQVCHTATTVRNIATIATFPKLKQCATASIELMKIASFLENRAKWDQTKGNYI